MRGEGGSVGVGDVCEKLGCGGGGAGERWSEVCVWGVGPPLVMTKLPSLSGKRLKIFDLSLLLQVPNQLTKVLRSSLSSNKIRINCFGVVSA